jgi:hypothetical protein
VLAVRSIRRAAFAAGPPVLDVRPVCTRAGDYSRVPPIEPSHLKARLRVQQALGGSPFDESVSPD